MTKKKVGRFLWEVLGALAFVAVSFYALLLAYGYQAGVDLSSIKKTSIIDIASRYKDVRVFLQGQLQTTEIPYQIKGISPGFYDVAISKVGFLPWSRRVRVENDLVTKVTDVLLVPENVSSFIKTVTTFVGDVKFFTGHDALIVLKPGQSYLTVISFFADGIWRDNEVQFLGDDVQSVEFISEGVFVVHYEKDRLMQAFDLISMESVSFILPETFENLKIDFSRKKIYFIDYGSIFAVGFDQLEEFQKKGKEKYGFLSDVQKFTLTSKGIFYLKNDDVKESIKLTKRTNKRVIKQKVEQTGVLFYSDFDGNNLYRGDRLSNGFTNLSARLGKNHDFLVLRNGEQRSLYFIDSQGKLLLLTSSLKGDYFLRQSDEVLFSTTKNELFFFDPNTVRVVMVQKLNRPFDLLGWYGEDYHFIFNDSAGFNVADMSFSNVFPFQLNDRHDIFYISNTLIYFLSEGKLKVLSFFTG